MTPDSRPGRHPRRLSTAALSALVVILAAVAGLWLHDHAPGLYVLFLLVALAGIFTLIRDVIRRDRAYYGRHPNNGQNGDIP